MTAEVNFVELKTKIVDVSKYVDSLSYSTNLFNHVKTTLELLAALVSDLDTKIAAEAAKVPDEPKAEPKIEDKTEKKSKTKPN